MAERPRIRRVAARGAVTRPGWQIPVRAMLHWEDGTTTDVSASATAWTRDAVEITWTVTGDTTSTDWIPSEDVRPVRPRRRR